MFGFQRQQVGIQLRQPGGQLSLFVLQFLLLGQQFVKLRGAVGLFGLQCAAAFFQLGNTGLFLGDGGSQPAHLLFGVGLARFNRPQLRLVRIELSLRQAQFVLGLGQLPVDAVQLGLGGGHLLLLPAPVFGERGQLGQNFIALGGVLAGAFLAHGQLALKRFGLPVEVVVLRIPQAETGPGFGLLGAQPVELLAERLQPLPLLFHLALAGRKAVAALFELDLRLPPAVTVPHPQQAIQVRFDELVFFGPLGLLFQPAHPRLNFFDNIVQPQQVALRFFQFGQRVGPFLAMEGDAGGFFKQSAALFGVQRQHPVDGALADDGVRLAAESAFGQQLADVSEADAAAVEIILVLAGAIGAAGNRHLRKIERQPMVGVVQHQRGRGHAQPRASVGAGKDHVLGFFSAQRAVTLFAQHPANSVGHVGFAAAVGANHGGNPFVKNKFDLVGE